MKKISVYAKALKKVNISENKQAPLLLTVTEEHTKEGLKVTLKGKLNPLPFKEAILTNTTVSVRKWLTDLEWIEIKRDYVK